VVRRVSDRQRASALAAGCAFWDGQRAMGGPGAMQRWLDQKLALKDMVHLNVKGSRAMAALLERALLAGLRDKP
jgi:lysophospholipase L1-like esterase